MTACSKQDEVASKFLECEQTQDFKMGDGEGRECLSFYYTLNEYNGEQYIQLQNDCADLVRTFVINENCVDICETDPYDENSECGQYLKGKEFLQILLVEK